MWGSQSAHEADQSHDQGRGAMAEHRSTSSEYFVKTAGTEAFSPQVWAHLEKPLFLIVSSFIFN